MKRQLLTSSRAKCFRTCPRKHRLEYEVGLRRIRTVDYFRLGGNYHRGLELRGLGHAPAEAIAGAIQPYDIRPEWAEPEAWDTERHTVANLLAGYFWRYQEAPLTFIATELTFHTDLVHPTSGEVSQTFSLAGKLDGIVRLSDGRLAVLEYKTAGEEIGPAADYWPRLRNDLQISIYMIGARALGYDVATVLYDVTRKPTIRLRQKEEPGQYGARLLKDTGERPEYYFGRREIARPEDELAAVRIELWQQAEAIREAEERDRWYRNPGRYTCEHCVYAPLCLTNVNVDPANPPAGFEIVTNKHPELGDSDHE